MMRRPFWYRFTIYFVQIDIQAINVKGEMNYEEVFWNDNECDDGINIGLCAGTGNRSRTDNVG